MSNDQMMRTEIAKQRTPLTPHRKIAMGAAALTAVLLIGGGVWGANAAIAYRADIEQMQAQTAENLAEIDELTASTIALAAEAQDSADAAQKSVDSLVAAEEAAAAQAAADEAVAQAAAARAAAGLTPEGKCPAGTIAGSVDDAGIEGNCVATSGGGQCVAYDDNNNCTQYYKP